MDFLPMTTVSASCAIGSATAFFAKTAYITEEETNPITSKMMKANIVVTVYTINLIASTKVI